MQDNARSTPRDSSHSDQVIEFPKSDEQRFMAAVQLASNNDAKGALSEALALIDRGYGHANWLAGTVYEVGRSGVVADYQKAAFYYKKAISTVGNTQAWLAMARLNYLGRGVPQNYEEAFRCYSVIAEESGNPMAWLMLGSMYFEGKGVKKNLIKAREYLRKAAEKRYVFAYTFLGHLERECGHRLKAFRYFLKAFWLSLVTHRTDPRSQLA